LKGVEIATTTLLGEREKTGNLRKALGPLLRSSMRQFVAGKTSIRGGVFGNVYSGRDKIRSVG